MLGKMNLMENIILGRWMSGEIPHSMTIYFILGFFIKSSVTSDYNEPSVSVTHVLRMISYLRSLCVLWPPWLWGAGEVAQCAMPARVRRSLYISVGGIILRETARVPLQNCFVPESLRRRQVKLQL